VRTLVASLITRRLKDTGCQSSIVLTTLLKEVVPVILYVVSVVIFVIRT
jgi:uncharacterized membrane protein YhaH (DUF805 family)